MKQPVTGEEKIVLTIIDGVRREFAETSKGQKVLDVLRQQGIYVNSPCGGRGTCGKCKVALLQGRLLSVSEKNAFPEFKEAGTEVLACLSVLVEDCVIDVELSQERGFSGTVEFVAAESGNIDAGVESLCFKPTEKTWDTGRSVVEEINNGLERRLVFLPKALRHLSYWMGEALKNDYSRPGSDRPVFLTVRDNRVVHVRSDEFASVYGIGVDIGTTTVALSLVNLATGEVQKTTTLINSQRQFGADVISRIQKGSEGFLDELRTCIQSDISRGIRELCVTEADAVIRMAVAGNTSMMHLLLGLRGDSLALVPFNPITTSCIEISSSELFGVCPVDCEVTLLPSIGAYMGADIVSGMMCCKMDKSTGTVLFVDVGTNGEMAIGNNKRILCTSTAAGPAFEGANITWGTGSIPGAISSFDMQNGEIVFCTIAEAPPVGICGSAVVDIVAACLREGIIDGTGRFTSEDLSGNGLQITQNMAGEWIRFTQKDVREFQLAKSAIRSGLEILVREYGCGWENIEQVFLAGGFGTRMNVKNAVEVGLFPPELQGKINPVGNTALGGTVHYLLFRESREALDTLTRLATVIDLSKQPDFNNLFMDQLLFEAK